MLPMITTYDHMHRRAKPLLPKKIVQALRFVLADSDVNVTHIRDLRELLQRMQQDWLACNLCELFRRLPRTSAGLDCHSRSKSRRGNDDHHFHGKRSIKQSGDRVIG